MSIQDTFNLETVTKNYTMDGVADQTEALDYFVFSLGVKNDTAQMLKLYFTRYNTTDFVEIPATSYKEIAVSTNWYRLETTGTGNVSIDLVRSASIEESLVPLYPNLYEEADVDGNGTPETDIKVDPINAYGYTATPWVATDGSTNVGDDSTVIDVKYYLDGNVQSVKTADWYTQLFTSWFTQIEAMYPAGYDITNPSYLSNAFPEVQNQITDFWTSLDASFEEEFTAGYKRLQVFNEDLYRTEYLLDTTDAKLGFPFELVGFITEETSGSAGATIDYWTQDDKSDVATVTLTAGQTTTTWANAKFFEVTSGELKLTFTGQMVKLINFAPIINIVYPLGFTDSEGVPAEAFTSFQNKVSALETRLANNKFTGRVVYLRAKPFVSQANEVWSADKWKHEVWTESAPLVWSKVRAHVPSFYQFSKTEEDYMKVIINENSAYYYGLAQDARPKTLDDVINDASMTVNGHSTAADKESFLVDLIIREYSGAYSLGGFSIFTPGSTYNRKD